MNRTLYTALFYLGLPLVAIRLWLRAHKAPAYAKRIGERFSYGMPTLQPGGSGCTRCRWAKVSLRRR